MKISPPACRLRGDSRARDGRGKRACAARADNLARQPGPHDRVARLDQQADAVDLPVLVLRILQLHQVALVAHDSVQFQMRQRRDLPGQGHRRLARLSAGPAQSDIDFHDHAQPRRGAGRRVIERAKLGLMIHGQDRIGVPKQFAAHLDWPDHLVGDQNAIDARAGHHRPQVGLFDYRRQSLYGRGGFRLSVSRSRVDSPFVELRRIGVVSRRHRRSRGDGYSHRDRTGSTIGSHRVAIAVRLVQAVKAVLTRRAVESPMKTIDRL